VGADGGISLKAERALRFRTGKTPSDANRLARFLASEAGTHVPHYKALFGEIGLHPERIRSAVDLEAIPITSRRGISDLPQTAILRQGSNLARLHARITSGSTGSPLTVYLSRSELLFRQWLLLRSICRVFPRGLPLTIADVGQIMAQKMTHPVRHWGPFKLHRIPAYLPIGEQVRVYVQAKPSLLEGYAGCLELLAEALANVPSFPRPRLVVSRGELLVPTARRLIERVFGCRVVDFYNTEEVGNIAWECPHRPGILHVNTDACILDLVDNQGHAVSDGCEGRVIVTNLYNLTMPLLRYDQGDSAIWHEKRARPCSCGAVTPTVRGISGRDDDFILLPDLRRISPLVILSTVMNAWASQTADGAYVGQVKQFQVVQERVGELLVNVIPNPDAQIDLDQALARELAKLHPALTYEVRVVDEIPLAPSGKLQRVVSRVGRL